MKVTVCDRFFMIYLRCNPFELEPNELWLYFN